MYTKFDLNVFLAIKIVLTIFPIIPNQAKETFVTIKRIFLIFCIP